MSISLKNFNEVQTEPVQADDVAARVKAARETVGYSIEDLAVTCGLANEELIDIESGAEFDIAHVIVAELHVHEPRDEFIFGRIPIELHALDQRRSAIADADDSDSYCFVS